MFVTLKRRILGSALNTMSYIVREFKGNASKEGGGSSNKTRMNEYIMINGRKKRLYKGIKGGLYTMEKGGEFKRVPRDGVTHPMKNKKIDRT